MNPRYQPAAWPKVFLFIALALAAVAALPHGHAAFAQSPATAQAPPNAPAPSSLAELKELNERVKSLVAKVRPAVVQVAGGSGVVVSADGLVMSVAHVGVHAGRQVVFVFPDGRRAGASPSAMTRWAMRD